MLHLATVHYRSDAWIEIQRRYLDRFLDEEFTLYASLEGIDERWESWFDVVVPSIGNHAGKLNLLGRVITDVADPDDVIIFIDGDAFPIADPMPLVRRNLEQVELTAVCRQENVGDRQPHPCFCAVTARFWRALPGDWCMGFCWANKRSDVGGNLLYALESAGAPWTKILRTNRTNLHPVLFGIYGDCIYHHGGAFRPDKLTMMDALLATDDDPLATRNERNTGISERIFADIQRNPDFFTEFL